MISTSSVIWRQRKQLAATPHPVCIVLWMFTLRCFKTAQRWTVAAVANNELLDIGNMVLQNNIEKFCYLGDMQE